MLLTKFQYNPIYIPNLPIFPILPILPKFTNFPITPSPILYIVFGMLKYPA